MLINGKYRSVHKHSYRKVCGSKWFSLAAEIGKQLATDTVDSLDTGHLGPWRVLPLFGAARARWWRRTPLQQPLFAEIFMMLRTVATLNLTPRLGVKPRIGELLWCQAV